MQEKGMFKKFLSFSIGSIISFFINIVATPMLTWVLLPEEFGRGSMFLLAMSFLTILVLVGTDASFIRFYYEEKTLERKSTLLKQSIRVPLLLGIIIFMGVLIFWEKISMYLFEGRYYLPTILLGISVLLGIFDRFNMLVIRMKQKGKLFSVLTIVSKFTISIGSLLLALIINKNFTAIVYSQVFALLVTVLIGIYIERDTWFYKNRTDKKRDTLEILIYGFPILLTTLADWFFQSLDKVFLKKYGTLHDLGLYQTAFKLAAVLYIVQTSFTSFWVPASYERFENNKNDYVFFRDMFDLLSIIMLIICFVSIILKNIVLLVVPPVYFNVIYVMPILIMIPMYSVLSEITVSGINLNKKTKYHIFISLITTTFNILLNILFIKKYGAYGAAMAMAISYFVFFMLRTLISENVIKMNYRYKKFILCNIILVLYIYFVIKLKNLLFDVSIGGACIALIIYIYKQVIIEAYSKLRKEIN